MCVYVHIFVLVYVCGVEWGRWLGQWRELFVGMKIVVWAHKHELGRTLHLLRSIAYTLPPLLINYRATPPFKCSQPLRPSNA